MDQSYAQENAANVALNRATIALHAKIKNKASRLVLAEQPGEGGGEEEGAGAGAGKLVAD